MVMLSSSLTYFCTNYCSLLSLILLILLCSYPMDLKISEESRKIVYSKACPCPQNGGTEGDLN